MSANQWTYTTRVIPGQIARARWRNTLVYRVNPDLQVGVEYNPLATSGNVGPLVNWRVLREAEGQPAIILGTSSDRIGTPTGQAYYFTVSKTVTKGVGLYVGASYSQFENRILIPFGASFQFDDHWSSILAYDGVNFHPTVSYGWDRYSVTFIYANTRYPGLSMSVGF